MKKVLFPILALVLALGLALPMAAPVMAQVVHGISIVKGVEGPSGTDVAHVGETATATIIVTNADTAGHAIRIDSIVNVVHHTSGDVSSGELLVAPVTLPALGNSVTVTHSYTVKSDDVSPLVDTASTAGVDLGTMLAVTGTTQAPLFIIRPAISIVKTVDCNEDGVYLDEDTGYVANTASWKIVVTNTGDSPVYDIMVSDTNGESYGPFDLLTNGAFDEHIYTFDVNVDTTNTATAQGLDGIGATVGPVSDSATNLVISPAISIEKTVDCNEDGVYLDEDTGYVANTASWKIVVTNTGDSPVYDIMVSDTNGESYGPFDLLTNGAFDEHIYTFDVNVDTTNTATAQGLDGIGGTVGPVSDSATNLVISPDTLVDIDASAYLVPAGGTVDLYVSEANTGVSSPGDDLTNVSVTVKDDGTIVATLVALPDSGDDGDGVLEVGETWMWTVSGVVVNTDTTFTATGYGEDSLGNPVTYPPNENEVDSVLVEVTGMATRTPGFWKTHYLYTQLVFDRVKPINLGWVVLDSKEDVFGMLWANKARESDGSKRDKLCQAKVITSFQAVAAILNTGLPNGAPLPMVDIVGILSGDDIGAIKALGGILDAYNNSGDYVEIEEEVPPADPQAAKADANIAIADCP